MEILEEDLAALSESIGSVLESECGARAVHAFFDGENDLDKALWTSAAELGWLGLGLPEDQGGLGMGAQGLDALFRGLGQAMAPGPFLSTLPAAQWLAEVGPADLCASLLPDVIAGTQTFAVPFVPGDRPLALSGGTLSGRSPMLLGSRETGTALVAVTDGTAPAWALVAIDGASARFTAATVWDCTRVAGHLDLEGAAPIAVIADADGKATASLRRWLALAAAGDCVGGARAVVDLTVAYLKDRTQFGRALASLQALKHRIADLLTMVIEAEAMLDQAIAAVAQGEPSADMWANLAKASAGEMFAHVAEDCVQLHGGVGFTWEFDCHIFLKRALLNREMAGNSGTLRDLAARQFAEATRAGETTAELTL